MVLARSKYTLHTVEQFFKKNTITVIFVFVPVISLNNLHSMTNKFDENIRILPKVFFNIIDMLDHR